MKFDWKSLIVAVVSAILGWLGNGVIVSPTTRAPVVQAK